MVKHSPRLTPRTFFALCYRASRLCTQLSNRTEKPIATVQAAGAQDVDNAVKTAHKAVRDPAWKLMSASDRGTLMFRLADLIEKNKELFATIDAWDNGKYHAQSTCFFR